MKISRRRLFQGGLSGGAAGVLAGPGLATAKEGGPPRGGAKKPKGIIFCVSDGMSQGVLSMTEAFSRQLRGKGTRWWELMSGQEAVMGLMDTASASSLVTDSAAASSAWGGGKRVPNGRINVDADGNHRESIGETLQKKGVRIGLVSTATITHATPAGFAATVPSRGQEHQIAEQYLNRVDVLLGGGSQFFKKQGRADRRDLAGEFAKAKYDVVGSRDELLRSSSKKILGTFSPGYLPYMVDYHQDKELRQRVPTLAEMAEAALSRFLDDEAPFLMQLEGARIDHAAHKNDIGAILHEQIAFDDAVSKVLQRVGERDDILVILTSDHGNANPALNGTGPGYRDTNEVFSRIARIKGSAESLMNQWNRSKKKDSAAMTELMESVYGFKPTPPELQALMDRLGGRKVTEWSHQLSNPEGLLGQIVGNVTGTGWTGIVHTSDPTQLTALGPGSERFAGLVRNDLVHGKLLELLLG